MNCQKEYKCVEENESILSGIIKFKKMRLTRNF